MVTTTLLSGKIPPVGGVTVGLVGCGTIGSRLGQEIQSQFRGIARLIGIWDSNPQSAQRLARRLNPRVPLVPLKKLIARSQIVIEAASVSAVKEILPEVTRKKRAVLVMSSGGLLQNPKVLQKAVAMGVPIYLPSGALVGIDGIKAAAVGRLRSVTLTTRKPPKAFIGAPGIVHQGISLSKIRTPRILFNGSAADAILGFPQNINVAATLALAGLGAGRTRVKIVADPTIRKNLHELQAIGDFGRIWTRTENRPSRENPKTSQLAVYSAVATLRQILQPLKVGT